MIAISKRAALVSGFAVIISLFVVSMLMAWRIQISYSERNEELHRQYVEQQDQLTNLRRILYLASAEARDYLLSPRNDRGQIYGSHLISLQQESNRVLAQLRASTERTHTVAALEVLLDDMWRTLIKARTQNFDQTGRYIFIQSQLIPRRDTASQLLRDLEKANHGTLAESEIRFRDTRTGAARRLMIILAFGLMAGSLVAVFSLRHSEALERQSAERFRQVSDAKGELERLSARLMEIQEEERTRLSRELHDEIVQNLAVLKMEILQAQAASIVRAPEIRETLSRARDLAERTVREVRDISVLLRPSLLDDLGLGPALQWLTEDFTRRTNVPCDFVEQDVCETLPETVKTCVYRVTQEALRNCEKHSSATHVTVELRQTSGHLKVAIADNGKGFDVRRSERKGPRHLGLLGMRERAAASGGTLQTISQPGKGTRVELTLPAEKIMSTQLQEVYA